MDIPLKIYATMIVIGFISCIVNDALKLPVRKKRYHTYSSIPLVLGIVLTILHVIWVLL
jgi:hypothetical protein